MKGKWIMYRWLVVGVLLGYPGWALAFGALPWIKDSSCWAIEAENQPLLEEALAQQAEKLKPLGWNWHRREFKNRGVLVHAYTSGCSSEGICELRVSLAFKANKVTGEHWVSEYRSQEYGFWRTPAYLEIGEKFDALLAPFVLRKAKIKDCFNKGEEK